MNFFCISWVVLIVAYMIAPYWWADKEGKQ
jgi:hypothetical protein